MHALVLIFSLLTFAFSAHADVTQKDYTGIGNIYVLNSSDWRTASPTTDRIGCLSENGKLISASNEAACGELHVQRQVAGAQHRQQVRRAGPRMELQRDICFQHLRPAVHNRRLSARVPLLRRYCVLLRRQAGTGSQREAVALAIPLGVATNGHHSWSHPATPGVGQDRRPSEEERGARDSGTAVEAYRWPADSAVGTAGEGAVSLVAGHSRVPDNTEVNFDSFDNHHKLYRATIKKIRTKHYIPSEILGRQRYAEELLESRNEGTEFLGFAVGFELFAKS
ncbi:hypothetical protein OPT61_g4211 [Boeremia exigua]|uniref:Uncharacterized protein n=1 Tax=Boeremia exigua TaxID=749465 RepID=A0ACC2IEU2_9PLEO|nr:hypothetical protein OPT61_g4211 [Boeremia exigua]